MSRRATFRGERTQVTKFVIAGLSRRQGLGAGAMPKACGPIFVFLDSHSSASMGRCRGLDFSEIGRCRWGVFRGLNRPFRGLDRDFWGCRFLLIETSIDGADFGA